MTTLAHTYLSFSKTYTNTLTVYTQAQITINPCSRESLWGPSCTGLDGKTQGLVLAEPPAIFRTQRAALLIKAIKRALVLAGVGGFENGCPYDMMGCSTQRAAASPAALCWAQGAPACSLRRSQALEGVPGRRGMGSCSSHPAVRRCNPVGAKTRIFVV